MQMYQLFRETGFLFNTFNCNLILRKNYYPRFKCTFLNLYYS